MGITAIGGEYKTHNRYGIYKIKKGRLFWTSLFQISISVFKFYAPVLLQEQEQSLSVHEFPFANEGFCSG